MDHITLQLRNSNSLFTTNGHAASRKKQDNKAGSSFYAGSALFAPDPIALKRTIAHKKALKLLRDTFADIQKSSQNIEEINAQKEALKQESMEDARKLREVAAMRQQKTAQYEIAPDSVENEELELLRRERDGDSDLTEEEQARLLEIHENGLTDYQKDMLELDDAQNLYEEHIANRRIVEQAIVSSLADLRIESLKSNPMAEADKQAEKIILAAEKEIFGNLWAEGKEYLDNKTKEAEEKAEKRKEKEEEQEEQVKEKEEQDKQQEEQIVKNKEIAAAVEAARKAAAQNNDISVNELKQRILQILEQQTEKAAGQSEAETDFEPLPEIDYNAFSDAQYEDLSHKVQQLMSEIGLTSEELKGLTMDMEI